MKKLHEKNYNIGGGSTTKLEKCFIGSQEDYNDFLTDLSSDMFGYVHTGDEFTLAWKNGTFVILYSELDKEEGEPEPDSIVEIEVWYDKEVDPNPETAKDDIYYFGVVKTTLYKDKGSNNG